MSKPNFKPWRFVGQGILIDGDENEIVLGNVYSDDQIGWLIAAAPDFAVATQDAKVTGWKHTHGCETGECWCYRLGAALAKAEGR